LSAVVDASVLVAATVDAGPAGVWAEHIVEGGVLFAPHLVLVEANNILRRLERANQLSALEAAAARVDLLRLDIDLVAFQPFADRVWELRHNLTCYDAWYVAVAEVVGLPLATLDRRLSRTSGPSCQFLTPA
jgi:predicted nucleic acid-binding protein